jgi:ABC-type sugar transport system permease subunit
VAQQQARMTKQLKIGWFEKNTKWLLLVPTIFLLLALTVYPLIYSFIAMLHKIPHGGENIYWFSKFYRNGHRSIFLERP